MIPIVFFKEAFKYLAYDVKGIQKYIFLVPKLKCIVGGSQQIDQFDQESRKTDGNIYAGGGRGLFEVSDENIDARKKELLKRAQALGLDLRLGTGENAPTTEANDLYPFRPEMFAATFPCALSGAYPVKNPGETHPVVKARMDAQKIREWDHRHFECCRIDPEAEKVFAGKVGLDSGGLKYVFFHEVDTVTCDEEDKDPAKAACAALGSRNRWAIVCMDGNDMGRQIGASNKSDTWFCRFSKNLAECTREAFYFALSCVINAWLKDCDEKTARKAIWKEYVILPFRPLILGGDDVTLLCHSGYAMEFVKNMAEQFHEISRKKAEAEAFPNIPLWPATGNALSISAGVLYCKTTFPLAMAMDYAEKLLASAKGKFRSVSRSGPTPAAVDWDTITESFVDTPAERRRREMWFTDLECGKQIHLTQKPYLLEGAVEGSKSMTLEDLEKNYIAKLRDEPTSFLNGILPGLRQSWSQRIAYLASIGKTHSDVKELLWEDDDTHGRWWDDFSENGKDIRQTAIVDAVSLLSEEHRMEQDTAGKER